MAAGRFEKLNPQQRRAVEHGGAAVGEAGPLLIIAGAGSGKTSTLAHRVAFLIENGADPRRIMLLTFSRRAAAEMTRRVDRILSGLARGGTAAMTEAMWAGTFHSVGARLLREHAEDIGLARAFTIHDREDSADLMNLVRHDLGFSRTEKRFPTKGTCLAIYSRAVNSEAALEEVLGAFFPWCAMWRDELGKLFGQYVEVKQRQQVLDYDDLLLYWAHMMQEAAIARQIAERFDHVLVDEYQDTNRLQASVLLALRPNGRGLTVVGDDAQSIYSFRAATVRNILDFPGHFRPPADVVTLEQNYRSTQPILERGERGHRSRRRALHQKPLVGAKIRRAPADRQRARRGGPGALRGGCGVGEPRGRARAQDAGGPVPRFAPQRPARSGADPAQHSLRQVRRTEVSRSRARQGFAGVPALGGKPARPPFRLPRGAIAARRGAGDGGQSP